MLKGKMSYALVAGFIVLLSLPAFSYEETYLDYVAETAMDGNDLEVAALPVVAILAAAGMFVLKKSLVRGLTQKYAIIAARNYSMKGARALVKRGKKCMSLRAQNGQGVGARVLLALDGVTVMWAGNDHKQYQRKINDLCY